MNIDRYFDLQFPSRFSSPKKMTKLTYELRNSVVEAMIPMINFKQNIKYDWLKKTVPTNYAIRNVNKERGQEQILKW